MATSETSSVPSDKRKSLESPPADGSLSHPQAGGTRKTLTTALTVLLVVLIVFSIVLAILYTVPLVSTKQTSVEWFGWKGYTPGGWHYYAQLDYGLPLGPSSPTCIPSNAAGNLTILLVWQSSMPNTSVRFWWSTGEFEPLHIVYSVNNTTQGGYSFPSALLSFLCGSWNYLTCQWSTSIAGAVIALTGVRAYNYTTSVPIL